MKTIKPYKGGRTSRLNIRILPETKAVICEVAEEQEVSAADVIEIVFGASWPEWKRRILAKRDSKTLRLRQGEVVE